MRAIRPIRITACASGTDSVTVIDRRSLALRAVELATLAWTAGQCNVISTRSLGVNREGLLVIVPASSDNVREDTRLISGLLPTLFEWYRVAYCGDWTCGPYGMRRWHFCGGVVAPVPWDDTRHGGDDRYTRCSSTGFVRWTNSAMLACLRQWGLNQQVWQRLSAEIDNCDNMDNNNDDDKV